MRKLFVRGITILAASSLGVGLCALPASAAGSITVPVTEDTFVTSTNVTATNADATTARVDDAPKTMFIKFTVTGVPAGAPVTSAVLTVTAGTSQSAQIVDVHSVTNSWSETTLNYNNSPALGAKLDSASLGSGSATFDLPITGNGTYSFAVARATTGVDQQVATSEFATATSRPKLVVNYGDAPINKAPVVQAGADASVELPASTNLDGTVSDDGLPSGSSVGTTWSKVSGPGSVSFGSPSAVDTTATFSVEGSYVLRLTATDGSLTSSDDVAITATTPPTIPAATEYDVLGISEAYVDSLPIDTPEWSELVAMADAAYTVDSADGAVDGSGNAVAGALVYLRTGNTTYKTKVETALSQVQSISPASWQHASWNRKGSGWIAAAQLVGKPARNTDGSLNAWGNVLNQHRTVTHASGPVRSSTMTTAINWDNNHGAAARQTMVAIEAYLDLPTTTSCNAMKAFLGGSHAGYAFVADTNPGANAMGWSDEAASWYNPNHYAGINPVGSPGNRSGAIPSDTWRDGGVYPAIGSLGSDHYIYGNLYREVAAMVTLAANGCSLWTYADSAAKRAKEWAMNNGVADQENDYLGNADPVFREVYGIGTGGDDVGTGENLLVASEWLSGPSWPVR